MQGFIAGRLAMAMGWAFVSNGAVAAGFAISDKSVSSLGTAFSGEAALAEDASTVYTNPAGMLQLDGRHLTVGLHRITTSADFTNRASNITGPERADADVAVLAPNFYYVTELRPDVRAGFGFNSPFGLGLEYEREWKGRYHTIHSGVRTFNLSPAVAFRATERLAIGASLDVQYLDADMKQAVDFGTLCVAQQMMGGVDQSTALAQCSALGLAPQQSDGRQRLTGDNWSWGFSLGVNYAISPATRAGAVLHSAVRHDISGKSDFSDVPAAFADHFTDSNGAVSMHLPEIVSLSVAHAASDRLTLLAGYAWTHWGRMEELRVDFANDLPDSVSCDNYKDASRYNIGARYRVSPSWLLRAGFAYDETPVRDAEHRSPRVPDSDRRWYTLGANWAPWPGFSLDLAYAYVSARDVPINNTDGMGHTLNGTYDAWGDLTSVQANWKF